VAEAMLWGEIEYRRGNYERAFAHLREAVHRDTHLVYDEPWGWMVPARHALGALLLEQHQHAEAADVFRADLRVYPNNPWSLCGLHDALVEAGDHTAAQALRPALQQALRHADVPIARACLCANAAHCCA
jgi:tetratricopeptide (TPR) repeat protein